MVYDKDAIRRELDPPRPELKAPTILFAKYKYPHYVKITDWWFYRDGYGESYCPRERGASTFARLSSLPEKPDHWVSETKQALKDGRGDPRLEDQRRVIRPQPLFDMTSWKRFEASRRDMTDEECNLPTLPRSLLVPRYQTTVAADYRLVHHLPKTTEKY